MPQSLLAVIHCHNPKDIQDETKGWSDMKISVENSSFFTFPCFGNINFDKLESEIRKRINNDETDSVRFIHEGLFILMTSMFNKLGDNVRYNKRHDGCSIWEMKTPDCSLAVFLKNGCLSYSVRVNTLNFQNQITSCYFSAIHMKSDFKSLLIRTMRDFAALIYECRELTYSFDIRDDIIPRGMYHTNGSWFSSEHEERILCPMHYYEGYIVFPIDCSEEPNDYDFVPNDWNTWVQEMGDIPNNKLSYCEALDICVDRCLAQLKSYNKQIDSLSPIIKAELESKLKQSKDEGADFT